MKGRSSDHYTPQPGPLNLRPHPLRSKMKNNLHARIMSDLLSIIAVILVVGWLVGFFGFGEAVGSFIHILLVIAIIVVLIRIISGRSPVL